MLWCCLAWTFDGPKILEIFAPSSSKQLQHWIWLHMCPISRWYSGRCLVGDGFHGSFAQVWFISWQFFVAPETLAMTVYHQLWFLLLQCLYLPCLCRFQFASPLCQQLWQVHHRPRASNSPSLQKAVHRSNVGCTRVHPQNLTSHLHF